jgi:hypothetical protein
MIVNFEFDEDNLVSAIIEAAKDDWHENICDTIVENIDASDIAEYVDTSEVAGHIDMDDLFSNVEIDYEELAEHIIDGTKFKDEVAALMWQQFSDEFGASMKCVREELAVIHRELDARAVPIWKRWFSNANKEETGIA